jgi:hypothetical protein
MARRHPKILSDDPVAAIPSYVKIPEGVFDDIDHYRIVVERVTRALSSEGQKRRSNFAARSCLYEGIRVEFSQSMREEEVVLDAFNSKIVLRAPKRKGESIASLTARRMEYLKELLRPVEAMRTIGVAQIYLVLKAEGRKRISKRSRKSK